MSSSSANACPWVSALNAVRIQIACRQRGILDYKHGLESVLLAAGWGLRVRENSVRAIPWSECSTSSPGGANRPEPSASQLAEKLGLGRVLGRARLQSCR